MNENNNENTFLYLKARRSYTNRTIDRLQERERGRDKKGKIYIKRIDIEKDR